MLDPDETFDPEKIDAELRALGYDPAEVGRTAAVTARLALENVQLLETCKRLYAICDYLAARQMLDLDDDAVARGTRGLVEGTDKIDLEWARIVIAEAEEE